MPRRVFSLLLGTILGCRATPARPVPAPCPSPEGGATRLFNAEPGLFLGAALSDDACSVALEYRVGDACRVNFNGQVLAADDAVDHVDFLPDGGLDLFFYRDKLRLDPHLSISWMGYGKNSLGLFSRERTRWRNRDGVVSAAEERGHQATHESGRPLTVQSGPSREPPSYRAHIDRRDDRWFAVIVGEREWGGYDHVSDLSFSVDGKLWGFRYREGGKEFVNVRGEAHGPFDEVSGLFWSQEGGRFAFKYREGKQHFVYVAGRVLGPYDDLSGFTYSGFGFSKRGDSYGFLFQKDGRWNSQLGERVLRGDANSSGWDVSPDNSTFVYRHNTETIVINGEHHRAEDPGSPLYSDDGEVMGVRYRDDNLRFLRLNARIYGGYQQIGQAVSSPDGSRLAFTYKSGGKKFLRIVPRSLLAGPTTGKSDTGPTGEKVLGGFSEIFFRFLPDGRLAAVYLDGDTAFREVL